MKTCLSSSWPHVIVNQCFCRKKVSGDYEALNDRLLTLPDQLSYDIMVSAIFFLVHCKLVLRQIPFANGKLYHFPVL